MPAVSTNKPCYVSGLAQQRLSPTKEGWEWKLWTQAYSILLLWSSKQQTNKQVRLGGASLILNKEKVQHGGTSRRDGFKKENSSKGKSRGSPKKSKETRVVSSVEEAAKSQALWASPATVESEKIQV